MNKFNFFILFLLLIGLNSCRSIQFTNDYISASSFVKSTEPSSIEKQNWYNLDIADDSIPGMIVKSKNIFENKSANQIDLFSEDEGGWDDVLIMTEDCKFEEWMCPK